MRTTLYNINQIVDFNDAQNRYVASPKQNTWILMSFELNARVKIFGFGKLKFEVKN